ncbi:chitin elicitor receptor kinase 1-like [Brassica napus]|uniref:chitin elicitor receptor kinase 1-like n=1 Tax=Brassica napus TaxID=3708 RepID=UPI0020788137|nr:chitin elicitor receptor kinase 1-like [Brassica napus]
MSPLDAMNSSTAKISQRLYSAKHHPPTMSTSYVLLANLKAGRCSNTAEVSVLDVLQKKKLRDDLKSMKATTGEGISYYSKSPGLGICNCFGVILFERKASANEELNAKEEELPKGNPLLDNTPTVFSVKRRWDDDVVSRIRHCSENNKRTIVHDLDRPRLSWRQKLEICLGAARGLHYIHTDSARSIIHRDMKSDNILFDENFMDKVSEFGLFKTSRS